MYILIVMYMNIEKPCGFSDSKPTILIILISFQAVEETVSNVSSDAFVLLHEILFIICGYR